MYDMITPTQESLDIVRHISKTVETFHHHYHILYDIAMMFSGTVNYAEIGTYKGASACLMLQRRNTRVLTIDTGEYVEPLEVLKNLTSFNVHNNEFLYIEETSQIAKTRKKVKNFMSGIDILFIDGDHSMCGIVKDFGLYEPMVNKNGYIVVDDYNDVKHNPQIHDIISDLSSYLSKDEYEIIGELDNSLGAYCSYDIEGGNCFIIKKLV